MGAGFGRMLHWIFWKKLVELGQKVLGKDEFKNPQGLPKDFCNTLVRYLEPAWSVAQYLCSLHKQELSLMAAGL